MNVGKKKVSSNSDHETPILTPRYFNIIINNNFRLNVILYRSY